MRAALTYSLLILSLIYLASSQNVHKIVKRSPEESSSAHPPVTEAGGHGEAGGHAEAGGHGDGGGGGHGHGYQVFHEDFARVSVPFIIGVWIVVSSVAKIAFHMTPHKFHTLFPESALLIVIGVIIGLCMWKASDEEPASTLTPTVFFLFMLPPIIFDAGYFMPNRLFFDHLGTILLMAVIGTIWNAIAIGFSLYGCSLLGAFGEDVNLGLLETLLFSSLISAVDPVAVLAVFEELHVDEILYICVFGESLLNDAVTVVLYSMFESYAEVGQENLVYTDVLKGFASFTLIACGGTIIGIIWGYVIAFTTRFTHHIPMLEPLLCYIMAYLAFLNAEIFHLSGIMSITFCGITMKNYVDRNITKKSLTTLRYITKMLSSSSETIIFIFLGTATVADIHDWNWAFVVLTILFCTVYRCIGVIVFSFMANRFRAHKLKGIDQIVMSYGGLRGGVAFALALIVTEKIAPHAKMFVTATIAMVYWTVILQGITIKPVVKWLKVKTEIEKHPSMNERIIGRYMDSVICGFQSILGDVGHLRIRNWYKRIDDKIFKPILLRDDAVKDHKIIETFETIAEFEALEFLKRNPSQFTGIVGSKTMLDLTRMAEGSSDEHVTKINDQNNVISNGNKATMEPKDIKYMTRNASMNDIKMHHLLNENMLPPDAVRTGRRLSYSRHIVDEDDVISTLDDNYQVQMKVRALVKEKRKQRRKHKGMQKSSNCSSRHALNVLPVVYIQPGERVLGSDKKLQDEDVLQTLSELEEMENKVTFASEKNGHKKIVDNNDDSDDDDAITFGHKDKKETKKEDNPWMFKKDITEGQDNPSFVHDEGPEAVQSRVLPWRKNEKDGDDDDDLPPPPSDA